MKKTSAAINAINNIVVLVTTFLPFLAAIVAGVEAFTNKWNETKPDLK